jgi:hypothetical protein
MVELEVDAPESLLRRLSRFVVGAAASHPRKRAKRKTPHPAGG